MFNENKLVEHDKYGLGIISKPQLVATNELSIDFSTCCLAVKKSELTETDIYIDKCFKIDAEIFFYLSDVNRYVNEKEIGMELEKLIQYDNTQHKHDIKAYITKNAAELKTILNKHETI